MEKHYSYKKACIFNPERMRLVFCSYKKSSSFFISIKSNKKKRCLGGFLIDGDFEISRKQELIEY